MADMDQLERQVIDIIAQKKRLPPENITLDSTFLDLGIDSLDGMDLLFAFEDTFNISIPDDVAQQMKTVRQVTDGLRGVLGSRAEAAN
jgi:acyl carrier protein